MSQTTRVQYGVMAGTIGGAVFVPYALTKGHLSERILARDWQVAGMSPQETANLLHLSEAVPMLLMAFGLLAVASLYDLGTNRLARAGVAITLVGFAATTLLHAGEHLLPALVVPALTGDADWFLWGYYLGWLTIQFGLLVCGAVLLFSRRDAGPIPWLFVAALPVAVTVGFAVVLADVFTFAGTHRLVAGLTWFLCGSWLWREPAADLADTGQDDREEDARGVASVGETDTGN